MYGASHAVGCVGPLTFEEECKNCGVVFTVSIDRFKDEGYINWLKGTLCLQYTKEGLEDFVETTSKEFHDSIVSNILVASNCQSQCELEDFRRDKFKCPYHQCDTLKAQLLYSSKYGRLHWSNTKLQDVMSSPTELAKLFMPGFCKQYSGPQEADCTAVLSLIDECLHFDDKMDDKDLVQKLRDSRNAIMHSGTMRLDPHQLKEHKQNCVNLLKDPRHLKHDLHCVEAIENIQKLCDNQIQVDLVRVEQQALDHIDQQHTAVIETFRETVESEESPIETLREVKEKIKESEEKEAQLKVLMEFYDVDSTKALVRKTKLNTLYEEAERKMEEANIHKLQEKNDQLQQKVTHIQKLKSDLKDMEENVLQKDTHIEKLHSDLKDTIDNALQKDDQIHKLQQDIEKSKKTISKKMDEKDSEIIKLQSDTEESKDNVSQILNEKEYKIKKLQEDLEESKWSVLQKLGEIDIAGAFDGNFFTFKKGQPTQHTDNKTIDHTGIAEVCEAAADLSEVPLNESNAYSAVDIEKCPNDLGENNRNNTKDETSDAVPKEDPTHTDYLSQDDVTSDVFIKDKALDGNTESDIDISMPPDLKHLTTDTDQPIPPEQNHGNVMKTSGAGFDVPGDDGLAADDDNDDDNNDDEDAAAAAAADNDEVFVGIKDHTSEGVQEVKEDNDTTSDSQIGVLHIKTENASEEGIQRPDTLSLITDRKVDVRSNAHLIDRPSGDKDSDHLDQLLTIPLPPPPLDDISSGVEENITPEGSDLSSVVPKYGLMGDGDELIFSGRYMDIGKLSDIICTRIMTPNTHLKKLELSDVSLSSFGEDLLFFLCQAVSLDLHTINLSHEQCIYLSSNIPDTVEELCLRNLYCTQHRYRGGGSDGCLSELDLTSLTKLRKLIVYCLPFRNVVYSPRHIQECSIVDH